MAVLVSVALVPVAVLAATATSAGAATPFGEVAIAARGMADPEGVTTGPDGNIWFASVANNAIGRVTPVGDVTLYVDPAFASPWDITAGPDGNVWFTAGPLSALPGVVGRITPAGAITVFDLPAVTPVGITAGPDGNLWFTTLEDVIGRITVTGTVTTFTDPTIQGPHSITAGADGNLWFTNQNADSIGRITPAGAVSSFPAPGVSQPLDITAGPGGLWFTSSLGSAVGHMTTAGVLTTFDDPGMLGISIAAGPDANLWITDHSLGRVVRLTPAGVFTAFPVSQVGQPQGITAGPDGNLWVGLAGTGGAIGRLTTIGELTAFTGAPVQVPHDITTGPDGNLWFTNIFTSSVARMTPAGVITASYAGGPFPHDITAGPDGNLWFTIEGDSSIGRMTTAGVFTRFTDPGISKPEGIAAGADGNLWFTSSANARIGRITPGGVVTMFPNLGLQKPWKITAGPDGALWFTDTASRAVGRITTAGAATVFTGVAPAGSQPEDITAGPDGNLWFTNNRSGGGSIGRITPAGVVQTFTAPAVNDAAGIAAGPNGTVWFTNAGSHSLGQISMDGTITIVGSPSLQRPNAIVAGPDGDMWFTDPTGNAVGSAGTTPVVPGAPTAVTATAGQGDAAVAWSPPASDGGVAITGYEVTANPGGSTCTTTGGLTCTIGGLPAGVPVTFTVRALNAVGPGPLSDPTASVVPAASSTFHPLTPARILDSRTSVGGWNGPLGPPTWVRALQVTGLGGASNVPDGAAAVVANVTVTGGTAPAFVSVWPVGANEPATSNLNFAPGETIANLVTVKLGAGGQLWFSTSDGAVDVIVDVLGYYDDGSEAGDRFNATVPARVLDSRTTTGGWAAPLAAGAPRDLPLRQPDGVAVPATATAVALNVTATGGSAGSFLSVWPAGGDQPSTSNLNFGAGQTIPNLVIVPIGTAGSVRFANAVGQVDVVADLVGYFDPTAGTRFHAITPTRILDDRVGTGLTGSWGTGQTRTLPVAGVAGTRVPIGATGLVVNVTATAATQASFVAVFPHGAPRLTSNLNFAAGQTIPNLVTVGIPAAGSIDLYNQLGSVDLVADAMGYYAET